jgi:excisionase family DNA binding protein
MQLMTYDETAAYLRMPKGTLYALVSRGGVPHHRIGKRIVRFERSQLDAWIASTQRSPLDAHPSRPAEGALLRGQGRAGGRGR